MSRGADPHRSPTGRAPARPPGYDAAASPYAGSPQAAPPAAGARPRAGRDRVLRTPEMLGYQPLEALGTLLVVLCGLFTLASLYRAYLALRYRNMIHRFGVELSQQPLGERDELRRAFDLSDGVRAVFLFLVGVLLIIWLARAYANLKAVSPPEGLAPVAKVVAVFALPIVNLVFMRRYLDDLWVRSESYLHPRPLSPKVVDFAWGACIAGFGLGALFDFGPVRLLEGNKLGSDFALLAAVAFVVMVIAIALVVYKVTQRLTIRCAEMTETVLRSAR